MTIKIQAKTRVVMNRIQDATREIVTFYTVSEWEKMVNFDHIIARPTLKRLLNENLCKRQFKGVSKYGVPVGWVWYPDMLQDFRVYQALVMLSDYFPMDEDKLIRHLTKAGLTTDQISNSLQTLAFDKRVKVRHNGINRTLQAV